MSGVTGVVTEVDDVSLVTWVVREMFRKPGAGCHVGRK